MEEYKAGCKTDTYSKNKEQWKPGERIIEYMRAIWEKLEFEERLSGLYLQYMLCHNHVYPSLAICHRMVLNCDLISLSKNVHG